MKLNAIFLTIATVALVWGVYWFFVSGSGNQPPLSESVSGNNNVQAKFQALAEELRPISFDTSIFSDPAFTSLVDLTTPVTPETSGRLDPFAVIPGVSGM